MESNPDVPHVDAGKFPLLAELKSEKNLQYLLKMHNRLAIDSVLLKELHGKDLILIMGRTGTGKSTFANSIISGADTVQWNEDCELVAT